MKNWYFKVNIDFTSSNGGIVATTESVQVKNSGDGKGFKNLSAAKDLFFRMVESTSKRDPSTSRITKTLLLVILINITKNSFIRSIF